MRVVRPVAWLMIWVELLHVAKELYETLGFGNTHIATEVSAKTVPNWPPCEPASMLGKMIERDAQFTPVNELKRKVVDMCIAFIDQCEYVVVCVDVKPNTFVAEVVRNAHPKNLGVEHHLIGQARREVVDMPKLPRTKSG
jgi:hypothetical protein